MSGVRLTTRQLFTATVVAAGLLTFARMMGLSDGATLAVFGPLVGVAADPLAEPGARGGMFVFMLGAPAASGRG
ncbi:MAG: hypothetical protein JNL18_13705 [Planctomycetaceae bacterium]|nr:hypothetical protein [Planctomycetaceae bacterium]